MQKACLIFALSLLPALFATESMAFMVSYGTTKTQVLRACGGGLQSGNGQTGCTKCNAKSCSDYNCSNGAHGVPAGCKVVVFSRASKGRRHIGGVQVR